MDTPLTDVSAALVRSGTVNEAWTILSDTMANHGFDRLLFGMNTLDASGNLAGMDDALILIRGEQGYIDCYLDENLYLDSPGVDWAKLGRGVMNWGELARATSTSPPSPHRRRIAELNNRYGLHAGFTISLADPKTSRIALLGIAAHAGLSQTEADTIWASHGKDLESLAYLFYMRILALPREDPRRPLSTRQRQALAWVGEGKTMRDIAQIMEIRTVTVEDHLRKAREALNALTTAQAVKKAARMNLI